MNNLELNDAELMRYSRQVLLEGWDLDAQLRLKHSRIVMVGAGGLGCPASEILARAGVGHIHLIDNDVIEESNLQRQTLFTSGDMGYPKAEIAAKRLAHINELITVTYQVDRVDQDNALSLLSLPNECTSQVQVTDTQASEPITLMTPFTQLNSSAANATYALPDVLLDCTDNFAIRDILNRVSVQFQVPLLSASAIAMTGQLALYEPSQSSGCYHCLFGDSIQGIDDTRNCANSGVLASTTAIMGALQANAALQFLGLGHNPLAQKLLLWDGQRMSQRLIGYQQDKHCPVCAQSSSA